MSADSTPLDTRRKARILIIEDEASLTVMLEELLIDAGFDVVGIAGRLNTALTMIESEACDVTILDANLAGVSAGPAARLLTSRGIPFVVLSGYSSRQQHRDFAGALFLQKPCQPDVLVRALLSILPAGFT